VVKALGDHCGRIPLDRTTALGMGPGGLGLTLGCDTSGGEQVAGWVGKEGVGALKAFNTTGCGYVKIWQAMG